MNLVKYFMKREFIVYAFVGGLCAFVDIGAYYLLNIILGVSYLIAHLFSVWLASTVKFLINKRFTFKNKSSKVRKQYTYSLIVLMVYTIVTEVMLFIFVDFFNFSTIVSKVLVLILGLSVNYVLDKKLTFGIV
ncbi:MAG: GtrA family protein [Nanoarchaeota archaeon]|nr:GtrA family protein [Nanoarchaeota archaeon]